MVFLGVYRALYDYAPQSHEELEIKDGDLLFVLEKSSEDDWWTAKKKAATDDEDEPEGLIPSNYIEEATPIHSAKALYDYTKQTDEELSFREEARLDVYDTSDPDWTLVGCNGEYGFAPAIYIEAASSAPAVASPPPAPAPPPMPARPEPDMDKPLPGEADYPGPSSNSPPSNNPAAALAGIIAQKTGGANAEPEPIRERQLAAPPPMMAPPPQQYAPEEESEEEAPRLPTRPISHAPMSPPPAQYASPPARSPEAPSAGGVSTSLPYRSVSSGYPPEENPGMQSPGGYHLYNVHEMVSAMGKNKKMPTTLGLNLGKGMIMISPEKTRDGPSQEWSAEKLTHYSIEGKHVFVELVRPSKSVDFHAGAKDTAKEIVAQLGELAGASRGEGLREVWAASAGSNGAGRKRGYMVYEFLAQGLDEVTVAEGDEVIVLDDAKSTEWWMVRRLKNGKEGVVPASYVEVTGNMQGEQISGLDTARSTVEQNRLEEQRLTREATKKDKRKSEKGSPGLGLNLPERASSLLGDSKREERKRDSAKSKPKQDRVRTWTDRSGTFKVEAEFIGLRDGKIHLHKQNGVKIAVPVSKMAVEDLEYVEEATGLSLDEDKPLSDIKRRSTQKAKSPDNRSGAAVKKPQHDWFDFFLQCGVNPQICERYAAAFSKDEMGPEVLPDVNAQLLRTLGLKEGDILRVMKHLDTKYERNKTTGDGEPGESAGAGGLFSGPDGVLRNNTRKGRPAPAVQTNDVVDGDAFKPKDGLSEAKATPLASAPAKAATSGFDDDAWDVKPSRTDTPAAAAAPAPAPAPVVSEPPKPQPKLNDDLSLLALPLQPEQTGAQPAAAPAPAPAPAPVAPAEATQLPSSQQQPAGADQALFEKIAALRPQQTGYQRPAPPNQQPAGTGFPMPPPPRASSAPGLQPQHSAFAPPPLQPQLTGYQQPMQTGFQPAQMAPQGQSLQELQAQQQAQQQYSQFQQQPTGYGMQQQNGMMPQMQQNYPAMQPQPTGFQPQSQFGQSQFGQPQPQQGYQQALNVGQQTGSPFADPPRQPFQSTPSALSNSFSPQQPTGYQQQPGFQQSQPTFNVAQPTGAMNGTFGQPAPQLPPQQTGGVFGPMAPLVPQKTGPPPPIRFGVQPGQQKLMPQKTGRAELSRATPQNPFGF